MSIPALRAWFEEYGKSIVLAKFAHDLPTAQAAYARALDSLRQEPDLELRRAKQIRLQTAWYLVLHETGQDVAQQLYTELRTLLGENNPHGGLQYAPMVAFCALQLRTYADTQGIEPLPGEAALRLIAAVPPDMQGPNYWSSAAYWGFKLRDSELLDAAFSYFVGDRPAEMAGWMHARLLVMRGLLNGNVDRQQLEGMLRLAELPRQLADIERELWPALEAQGCVTEEVAQLLAARRRELGTAPRTAPRAGA